ncbi:MAG: autotransporter-associated beta strand repeat-containing protein [Pirellulales bacterium]
MIKAGAGTLLLPGANTYTGATIIEEGILNTNTSSLRGEVVNNGTVEFQQSFDGAYDENISGTGTLVISQADFSGRPIITLTGNNTYTGDTIVRFGTLRLEGPLGGSGGVVRLEPNTSLIAKASVGQSVAGSPLAAIFADTNDISLGDTNSLVGFSHGGTLRIGANVVTLRSRAFAALGPMTTLGGGTISAPNGIFVAPGGAFVGSGAVNGKVSAGVGSTTQATGNLSLGSASDFDGFFSDGVLRVGEHTVTIHDRNQAVLGSLTTLGAGGNFGTLSVPNGSLLEAGKNVVGYGTVEGEFVNRGAVHGEGPSAGDGITLIDRVTGDGSYSGTVTFFGALSPGNSPAMVAAEDVRFGEGARLEFELGGRTAGDDYDVLASTGEVVLAGTLRVELIRGFAPSPGDEFRVLSYGSRAGTFDAFEGAELGGGLYLGQIYGDEGLTLVAALGGDVNLDGEVNRLDLAVFTRNLGDGTNPDWPHGDFDGDGRVGLDDLLILKRNYGRSAAELAAVGVPEPSGAMIVTLLLFVGAAWYGRRRV